MFNKVRNLFNRIFDNNRIITIKWDAFDTDEQLVRDGVIVYNKKSKSFSFVEQEQLLNIGTKSIEYNLKPINVDDKTDIEFKAADVLKELIYHQDEPYYQDDYYSSYKIDSKDLVYKILVCGNKRKFLNELNRRNVIKTIEQVNLHS